MTEEFVSLEIAKKLKEEGYNKPFYFYYRTDDECIHHVNTCAPLVYSDKIDDEVVIAPTISQVLKWLREEKRIHIGFGYSPRKKWRHVIMYMDDRFYNKPTLTVDGFLKIEQAAIAGIEYCLDNLI